MSHHVSPEVTGTELVSDPSDTISSSPRKGWTEPKITQLPALNELTLQSTAPIPGGGGTGGGGTTVIP
jgi:hypothetical protein